MARAKILFILLFLGGGHLASPFALAQATTESRLQLAAPELPQQQDGRLLVIAFRDGKPASDLEVQGAFGTVRTRADGTATVTLPPGQHRLNVPLLEQKIEFNIVPGEETQVTIHTLGKTGDVEVAQPSLNPKTIVNSTAPKHKMTLELSVAETKQPLPDATVLVSGTENTFKSDVNGKVEMELVPGTYAMSIFHPKFQTQTLPAVNVEQASVAPLKLTMLEAGNELEEVVVLAPKVKGSVSALVEVRRQTSAVTDVMGAEQMARSGDSDAAASLRRVTGLTLVGGKYVYVRGLGERYSSVQMNSFGLPSPEPSRRVVPLDLFPTSTLESVVVQKSYSPDLPGEFGGGVIQLQTRSLPEKYYLKIALSTSYDGEDDRLSYRGGSTDWLGMDDGDRKMPTAIRSALGSGKKLVPKQTGSSDGISEQELTELGRSLKDGYNTEKKSQATPLPGLSMAIGNRYKLAGTRLGVAASGLYGQDIDSGEKVSRGFNVGAGDRLDPDYEKSAAYSEVETRLAGNLDLGLEIAKNHRVGFSTFILRNTTNFTQIDDRQDASSPSTTETTTLEWTERQLWTKHFKGKHGLQAVFSRPVEFEWRAGWADAKRDQPDRREYTYDKTSTSYLMRGGSDGNRRTYSELKDNSKQFGADLSLPLLAHSDTLKLKLGADQISRERRSDVFRLYFARDFDGPPATIDLSDGPEEQFQPDNIGPGKYQLQNITDTADSYSGDQTVNAQYAMIDYAPLKSWSFQAGARHERSIQSVKTFRYFEPGIPFTKSELVMDDVLPAYSAVWKPNDQLRSRVAYSETLARPDFRELSEVGFIDDETGYQVEGDSTLKGTVIHNIDHRWEYYFTSDEYVSLGGFYKRFLNPIEVMFKPGVNNIQTFANAKAATNYGVELESRVGLRHVTRQLRRWSVLSNLTLIQSKIELDERNRGIQTSDSRPLQGQSPYVVNLQLQYDRPLWGFSATLLYNVVGQRITEVGTNERPDTYEQPFHQLDFVASKSYDKTWTVALRAKNILDPVIEAKQDVEVVRSLRRGRTLGLSLSAIF